jgi:hypothetical protein
MVNITIGRVPRFGKVNPLEAHLMIGDRASSKLKSATNSGRNSDTPAAHRVGKSSSPNARTIITCGVLTLYVPISFSISLYSIFEDAKFRSISRIFKKNTAISQNRLFRALGS